MNYELLQASKGASIPRPYEGQSPDKNGAIGDRREVYRGGVNTLQSIIHHNKNLHHSLLTPAKHHPSQ
ncbi:MAG: hypothetical protein K6F20_02330 [Bacteroidaceae bacterium]|nr:hypothetical protein [Bacteroidaceae bacterium]